jgi:hypothetical protein
LDRIENSFLIGQNISVIVYSGNSLLSMQHFDKISKNLGIKFVGTALYGRCGFVFDDFSIHESNDEFHAGDSDVRFHSIQFDTAYL